MIGWLTAGDADPASYRMPVIVAALFVLVPSAMVPVMASSPSSEQVTVPWDSSLVTTRDELVKVATADP